MSRQQIIYPDLYKRTYQLRLQNELERRVQERHPARKFNVSYLRLLAATDAYLNILRNQATSSEKWWESDSDADAYLEFLQQFQSIFKHAVPELAQNFDVSVPTPVYIRNVIDFGIAGVDSEPAALVFEGYFLAGGTHADIAHNANCSRITIARLVSTLPELIAYQIWVKNLELRFQQENRPIDIAFRPIDPHVSFPTTKEQRRKAIVQNVFDLSSRQAEVLLEFCRPGGNVGRRSIANGLFISENTLKKHIRAINGKMQTKNMREAVAKASRLMRRYPEAEWDE